MSEKAGSTIRRKILLAAVLIAGTSLCAQPAISDSLNYLDISAVGLSNRGDQDVSQKLRQYIQSGLTISFPPGRYLFTSTLIIPEDVSNVQILGVPGKTFFLKAVNAPLLRVKGDHNFISGVVLDGQCTKLTDCGPDPNKGSTILVNGNYNIFYNLILENAVSNGLHFDGQKSGCQGNMVISSLIQNNMRVGIASAASRNLTIVNNEIRVNGYEGITADLSTAGIHVYKNSIEESNGLGGIGAMGFDNMSHALIEGNKFSCDRFCNKPFLRSGNATGESSDVFIVGNDFKGDVIAIDLRGTVRSTAGNHDFLIQKNSYQNIKPGDRLRTGGDDHAILVEDW